MSFSERGESRLTVTVRWIAVVPAAVLSHILFDSIFMHIARWNLGHIWFIDDPEPFVPIFSSGAAALAFVLTGAAVAPNSRGIVALVLLVLQSIVASFVVGLIIGGVIPAQPQLPAGLNFLGNLLGAGVGFYLVFRTFGWRGAGPVSLLWRGESAENV